MFSESQVSGNPIKVNFAKAFHQLTLSGMYWKNTTRKEAEIILGSSSRGSFLIRDSSSNNCVFALSLKSKRKMLHVRIIYHCGLFSLESEFQRKEPSFSSLVSLIEYYIEESKKYRSKKLVSMHSPGGSLYLSKPLKRTCPSLKHLCRVRINQSDEMPSSTREVILTKEFKEYFEEYPFKL